MRYHSSESPLWPIAVANAAIGLALLLFCLHLWLSRKSLKSAENVLSEEPQTNGLADKIGRRVTRAGGLAVFSYKMVRFSTLVVLLGLVVVTSIQYGWSKFDIVLTEALVSRSMEISRMELRLTCWQMFAVILAAANALASARTSLQLSSHLTFISFAVFVTYAYRDLWPLMTFTLRSLDESEGKILWVKIALAAWAGVLGPACEPYPYIPLHPKVCHVDGVALSCLTHILGPNKHT